jgi:hypothetical protein
LAISHFFCQTDGETGDSVAELLGFEGAGFNLLGDVLVADDRARDKLMKEAHEEEGIWSKTFELLHRSSIDIDHVADCLEGVKTDADR